MFIIGITILGWLSSLSAPAPDLKNDRFEIYVQRDNSWIIKEKGTKTQWLFTPEFVVLTSSEEPEMAMRPAGIKNVMYNVVTWKARAVDQSSQTKSTPVGKDVAGDGFDDRILKGNNQNRTANVFKSGNLLHQRAMSHKAGDNKVVFKFPGSEMFGLSAILSFDSETSFPTLQYTIRALKEGFYSVGYLGAPENSIEKTSEIWQPMVWQEKRFPEQSFLHPGFPMSGALGLGLCRQ